AGFDPELLRRYAADFEADDTRSRVTKLLPVGRVIADHDLYYDEEAFRRSRVWNEFYEPADIVFKMNCILIRQESRNTSLPFHRGRRQGPYTDRERALFATLVPHLQRAINLHFKIGSLETRSSTFADVLELMPDAAFLTTSDGRVLSANMRADEALARRDGLVV